MFGCWSFVEYWCARVNNQDTEGPSELRQLHVPREELCPSKVRREEKLEGAICDLKVRAPCAIVGGVDKPLDRIHPRVLPAEKPHQLTGTAQPESVASYAVGVSCTQPDARSGRWSSQPAKSETFTASSMAIWRPPLSQTLLRQTVQPWTSREGRR